MKFYRVEIMTKNGIGEVHIFSRRRWISLRRQITKIIYYPFPDHNGVSVDVDAFGEFVTATSYVEAMAIARRPYPELNP